MPFLYEIHLHTYGVSKCAVTKGPDYVRPYKDKGYQGIFVTDHFFNANCALPRSLPWKEWVDRFCKSFEDTKEAGEKYGLDVFFGWEETFDSCDDYLVYGLDKKFLLEHPEVRTWTRGQQYRAVKEAGGCVVQAHPFRQRYYIAKVVLSTGCVDAVEAANGGNEEEADALAFRYANKLGKPVLAGSDVHDVSVVRQNGSFGVYFDKKLESTGDFIKAVRNNEISGLKTDNSRFRYRGDENVFLPVEIRDKEDKVIRKSWKEFI